MTGDDDRRRPMIEVTDLVKNYGAVLAVRYDISRFPQVERARRQLDGAGIAVLGTVINGMRHSDSYYGRYSYARQRASQPNLPNTI